jgi:hypothetical protein
MSPARPVRKDRFRLIDTCDAKAHVEAPYISTEDLTRRLGLDTADFYVARRQLGWLGHVARMDYTVLTVRGCGAPYLRLPRARRMLSCWVAHPRPRGAPRMTYGRSVGKALDTFGLDRNKWPELAADRLAWRAMLRSGVRRAVPTCTARRLRLPPSCSSRSHTRAQATLKRPMAATNAAIQNSMQQLSLRRRGSA